MSTLKPITHLTWVALLLTGSCYGPRTYSQPPDHPGVSPQVWTVLAADPKGDARDQSSADAAQLAYRYDKQEDFLWFRVSLYGTPNSRAFGVNIVFDTGGDDATRANWWGANKSFRFDKLVSAWVTHTDHGYQGTIGVGDSTVVNAKQINNLRIRVVENSILIGVKRTDVTDKLRMNLIADVGSNRQLNDNLPNGGSAAIDLSAGRPKQGLREIDLGRNNFEFSPAYNSLPANRPPQIAKKGRGRQTLILVPGMYSGVKSFDSFVARNQTQYKFYIVTPPGVNGTPARAMPTSRSSFGELTWTRQLERDILDLISREKLIKPVIIAESHPASIAAIELALEHPDKIGGVTIAGTNLVQSFPSPKDPTRKRQVTLSERVALVDEGWGATWFKHVTAETWKSNDMPPKMLAGELSRGQDAWEDIEAAPLAVKIRYLCEFWASDVTLGFEKLQVPVLVLIAGFDQPFLTDPANSFSKFAYVDSWETLVPKHPMIELVKIPNARLLILDDQPQMAEDAIAKFVDRVSRMKLARNQEQN